MPDNKNNSELVMPTYPGGKLRMRTHGVKLCIYLPSKDPAYRSLLEKGYFSDGKRIVT